MGLFGRMFESSKEREKRLRQETAEYQPREKSSGTPPIKLAPTKPQPGLGSVLDAKRRHKKRLESL